MWIAVITSLVCIVVIAKWWKNTCIEKFTTTTASTTLLCFGDSVLNNSNYAENSVEYYLKKKVPSNYSVKMHAQDGATISSVVSHQLQTNKFNKIELKNCRIILSIGGNDLLMEKEDPRILFRQFVALIKEFHNKFGETVPLYVLGLYYPPSRARFNTRIREWNSWLLENSATHGYIYVPLDTTLISKSDICFQIEPSEKGGVKIAEQIVKAF